MLPIQRLLASVLVCLGLSTAAAQAHSSGQPPHQSFAMGDLRLESDEVIRDFAISYVTHGTLNAERSNAILMRHSNQEGAAKSHASAGCGGPFRYH